jgi:hypothetical protein
MAVVRDMHVRHNPVVVADDRFASILHRPAADGTEFADRVAVADRQLRWLVSILFILRVITYRGELVDVIVLADRRRAIDHNMAVDARSTADHDAVTNYSVGPHIHVICDARAIGDDCRRVNHVESLSSFFTLSDSLSSRLILATLRFQARTGSTGKLDA